MPQVRLLVAVLTAPAYRVPLVAETKLAPTNGYRVASTFSGAGGGCYGWKLAGFEVVYASEFVPAARDTYLANWPDAVVDARDIREVRGSEVLSLVGPVDVLEGSPPCASFSTAGKRERYWGATKSYSDTKQRVDDLFDEWLRLVDEVRPKVAVAENVTGLAKGVSVGYLNSVLRRTSDLGYVVEARVLDASWLGVPQSRKRVIIVGVREDLGRAPAFPKPLPYRYSIEDALRGLPPPRVVETVGSDPELADDEAPSIERFAIGREWYGVRTGATSDRYFQLVRPDPRLPLPTITATGGNVGAASVTHPSEARKWSIAELRRLGGFPDDFVLTGSYGQRWERIGRAVPPPMMAAVASTIRDEVLG